MAVISSEQRQGEADELQRQAKRFNRRVVDVEGDGNCFYRAMSRHFHRVEKHHALYRQWCTARLNKLRLEESAVWKLEWKDIAQHRVGGDFAESHHVRAMALDLGVGICVVSVTCGPNLAASATPLVYHGGTSMESVRDWVYVGHLQLSEHYVLLDTLPGMTTTAPPAALIHPTAINPPLGLALRPIASSSPSSSTAATRLSPSTSTASSLPLMQNATASSAIFFDCPQCDEHYKSKQRLKEHVTAVHGGGVKRKAQSDIAREAMASCPTCGKQMQRDSLRRHNKICGVAKAGPVKRRK